MRVPNSYGSILVGHPTHCPIHQETQAWLPSSSLVWLWMCEQHAIHQKATPSPTLSPKVHHLRLLVVKPHPEAPAEPHILPSEGIFATSVMSSMYNEASPPPAQCLTEHPLPFGPLAVQPLAVGKGTSTGCFAKQLIKMQRGIGLRTKPCRGPPSRFCVAPGTGPIPHALALASHAWVMCHMAPRTPMGHVCRAR